MKKIYLLLLALIPLFAISQNERMSLEKDLTKFITANNDMDCDALLYYAPKLVFVGVSEAEFLFDCQHDKLNRMDFMKKTMGYRYVIDTLVISNGSKYAKVRIPADVEIAFAETEPSNELHNDSFYYRLIEAYCGELLDRPYIGELYVDHDNHKVYYSSLVPVLGIWDEGHWTFLQQQGTQTIPPLEILDPDILYQ